MVNGEAVELFKLGTTFFTKIVLAAGSKSEQKRKRLERMKTY